MATTIEELEKRIMILEGELARLLRLLDRYRVDETPAERGERMLREARLADPQFVAGWKRASADYSSAE